MPSDSIDPDAPRPATASETALSRRVDLTTLRLFIAICEEQNLTRAANREGIAASAVSRRMNDFELAFGVTLFRRLSKGMALTPAGEALLHHARLTLLNVEKIAVELSEYSHGVRGHVRMLANLSAIVQFLPEDLSAFFAAHDLLRVDLQERPSGQVISGIGEGAAEIGICSGAAETRSLGEQLKAFRAARSPSRCRHGCARCWSSWGSSPTCRRSRYSCRGCSA